MVGSRPHPPGLQRTEYNPAPLLCLPSAAIRPPPSLKALHFFGFENKNWKVIKSNLYIQQEEKTPVAIRGISKITGRPPISVPPCSSFPRNPSPVRSSAAAAAAGGYRPPSTEGTRQRMFLKLFRFQCNMILNSSLYHQGIIHHNRNLSHSRSHFPDLVWLFSLYCICAIVFC